LIPARWTQLKAGKTKPKSEDADERPFRPVKLEGLLEGYDFSPEFIAEARRGMWGNFPGDIQRRSDEHN
jgi:hypothetical protein